MIPWRLVLRHLQEHWLRSALTLGSVTLAVLLICLGRTMVVGLSAAVDAADSRRLIAQSAVSLFVNLPESYQAKIDAVEGVEANTKYNWFGAIYQSDEKFFGQFSVDPDRFFDTYPEIEITDGSAEDFQRDRRSCLVGEGLVAQHGFEVGQTIPLIGRLYIRQDESPWEFTVAGVYTGTADNIDTNTLFFHHEYLRQSLEQGDALGPEGVSVYALRVAEGSAPERVQAAVDDLFATSEQRVQTTTEAEFNRQFVTMLGNVPTLMSSIGGGVVFAILLAVLNTMLMAARERTQQMGVVKALGFTDAAAAGLLLAESLLLCALGGLLGLALAAGAIGGMPPMITAMVPNMRMTGETVALALGGSLLLGLAAGAVPAWQMRRLRPVEAFRRGV